MISTELNRKQKNLFTGVLTALSLCLIVLAVSRTAQAETYQAQRVPCTKLIDNGPDKDRIVLLIAGEGYTKEQSQMFKDDVDRIITKGLLGHDFFKDNFKSFNVYVTENWSNSPGASTGAGPKKDTAFDITFNNNKWSAYFGEWYKDQKTLRRLSINEASSPSQPNHIILLVNTNHQGHGGETLGNYVTLMSNADPWWVLQHEMGHAIGRLLDEYSVASNPEYNGPAYGFGNSATTADRYKMPWSAWIDPATPVPTPFWFKPKNGIGVYVGGATYGKGTYRPSMRCRMNHSEDEFCQVCKDYMTLVLNQKNPDPNNPLAIMTRGFTVGLDRNFNPAEYKNSYAKNQCFTLTKSTLLLPSEPKPLPFLTPPSFSFPNFLVAQAYDKNGPKQTQQIPNPFMLRSFPANGKQEEFTRMIDQVSLGLRLPVSYDSAKEGFGVRLYKLNQTKPKAESIAELKGLKGQSVVERVSAQTEVSAMPPPPDSDTHVAPHVVAEPVIDQETLERLKRENKVTLIQDIQLK